MEYLYFACSGPVIKIGISNNPRGRLSGLHTQFYKAFGLTDARYIALMRFDTREAVRKAEIDMLRRARAHKIAGREWHNANPELLCLASEVNQIKDLSTFNRTSAHREWTKPNSRPFGRPPREYAINGESLTLVEWADRYGVVRSLVDTRMKRGLTLLEALTVKTGLARYSPGMCPHCSLELSVSEARDILKAARRYAQKKRYAEKRQSSDDTKPSPSY